MCHPVCCTVIRVLVTWSATATSISLKKSFTPLWQSTSFSSGTCMYALSSSHPMKCGFSGVSNSASHRSPYMSSDSSGTALGMIAKPYFS